MQTGGGQRNVAKRNEAGVRAESTHTGSLLPDAAPLVGTEFKLLNCEHS